MKVFSANYDGRSRRIVAAKSQKEAARLMGMTLYQFRNYGGPTGNQEDIELAMSEPGAVWSIGYGIYDSWEKVKP